MEDYCDRASEAERTIQVCTPAPPEGILMHLDERSCGPNNDERNVRADVFMYKKKKANEVPRIVNKGNEKRKTKAEN